MTWFVSATKAFKSHLEKDGLALASIVCLYATVRHSIRWLHRKFLTDFPFNVPLMG